MKFGQLVLCATAGCVGGLKDFVQLVSTGYGSAMALQAAVGGLEEWGTQPATALLQQPLQPIIQPPLPTQASWSTAKR